MLCKLSGVNGESKLKQAGETREVEGREDKQKGTPTSQTTLMRAVREGTLQRCKLRPEDTSQVGREGFGVTEKGGGLRQEGP